MKILITGANGLLGQHLVNHLLLTNHQIIATGKGPTRLPFPESDLYSYLTLDISDKAAIEKILQQIDDLDVVIHAAASTQVDECENNKEAAYTNNVIATSNLLEATKGKIKQFVYISTDFVFDGEKGFYKEDDVLNPVNWYGQTKKTAEEKVRETNLPWTIIRTCLVYGNTLSGTRANIITWVKDNLENNRPIKVVSDQVRTPTYVEDLAKGIILAIEKNANGIFHISGNETLTPYDMAMKTVSFFNLDATLITKVDASTFSQPGKRPQKTGFSIEKAQRDLGYQPISFEEGIKKMFAKVQ